MATVIGETRYEVVGGGLERYPLTVPARIECDVVVPCRLTGGEHIATTLFPEIGPGVVVCVRLAGPAAA